MSLAVVGSLLTLSSAQDSIESGGPLSLAFDDTGSPVDPSAAGVYRYRTRVNGTLLVEATAPTGDPALLVVCPQEGTSHRDENSGGGTTAFLAIGVEADVDYELHLLARPEGGACVATLLVREVEETDEVLALFERVRQRFLDLNAIEPESGAEAGRELLARTLTELQQVEQPSLLVVDLLWDLGRLARQRDDLTTALTALSRAESIRAELLPRAHPELLRTRLAVGEVAASAGRLELAERQLSELVELCQSATAGVDLMLGGKAVAALVELFRESDRLPQARGVAATWLSFLEARPATTPRRSFALSDARWAVASLADEARDYQAASVLWGAVVEELEAHNGMNLGTNQVRWRWCVCLAAAGHPERALVESEAVLRLSEQAGGTAVPDAALVQELRRIWREEIASTDDAK